MYQPRTDLAMEAHELAAKNKNSPLDGVIFREEIIDGYKLTRIEILNEKGEAETGKPVGKYLTLQTGKLWEGGIENIYFAASALSKLLSELIDCNASAGTVLVTGLGNMTITADAIGPKSVSHIIVTRHLKSASPELFDGMGFSDVAAISPGVLSQTGIETVEIVKSVSKKLLPSVIIAIDSLAARDISRLGSTIQLTDTGIAPGAGIGNRRVPLNEKTLGIPVISIGIPTVVDAITLTANILEKYYGSTDSLSDDVEEAGFFVTPKDTDKIISYMSKVIGYAVNMVFHDNLSYEEMISLSN
ncbi:MAG: GPR endopeptidase [Clostridia bacterium]|nr:GPR endopeptidase [Clostridia bacterium]